MGLLGESTILTKRIVTSLVSMILMLMYQDAYHKLTKVATITLLKYMKCYSEMDGFDKQQRTEMEV